MNRETSNEKVHGGPIYIKVLIIFSLYAILKFIGTTKYKGVMAHYLAQHLEHGAIDDPWIRMYNEIATAGETLSALDFGGIKENSPRAYKDVRDVGYLFAFTESRRSLRIFKLFSALYSTQNLSADK